MRVVIIMIQMNLQENIVNRVRYQKIIKKWPRTNKKSIKLNAMHAVMCLAFFLPLVKGNDQ